MTNSFADIANPAILRAMVQDGVKCERCAGAGWINRVFVFARAYDTTCTTCNGSGHTPLSNANLDALAACWCEGKWLQWHPDRGPLNRDMNWHAWIGEYFYPIKGVHYDYCPTTSPDAAMRLQVKYKLQPEVIELQGKEYWYVLCGAGSDDCSVVEGITIETLCQALTEAALVAALTAAMEGDSDAGD